MKEYKITNSNTRKIFKSLDEVKNYVSKNKVRPYDGTNTLVVQETITKYHDINIKADTLTIETFHKLVDILLNYLSTATDVTIKDGGITSVVYTLRAVKKLNIPEVIEHFKNGLIAIDIDYDLFDKYSNAKNFSDTNWDWINCAFEKSEKKYGYEKQKELIKSTAITILNYLKACKTIPEEFTVIKLRTNYKPCNAIGIKTEYLSIGYRQNGPIIGRSMFTGRNVSYLGDDVLTETSLSKLIE